MTMQQQQQQQRWGQEGGSPPGAGGPPPGGPEADRHPGPSFGPGISQEEGAPG